MLAIAMTPMLTIAIRWNMRASVPSAFLAIDWARLATWLGLAVGGIIG